jgi:hypothetical protein
LRDYWTMHDRASKPLLLKTTGFARKRRYRSCDHWLQSAGIDGIGVGPHSCAKRQLLFVLGNRVANPLTRFNMRSRLRNGESDF